MVYHICNKSISDFVIFNNDYEFSRMLLAIRYYQSGKHIASLARFLRPTGTKEYHYSDKIPIPIGKEKFVNIIAYCLMSTHLHLILEELIENGLSMFTSNILNSYTRYFNAKHNRKGPLWEGRSKRILVKSDEQLLYLTSYIHLNPVTAHLVNKPEDWPYSSYKEYISNIKHGERTCNYAHILKVDHTVYKKFVEDGISYQRELARIKNLTLE